MHTKKRILVTSALPYINGIKHLGNLVGSMLPADVYVRFARQRFGDENVLFICATDEHGTPAELAAVANKESVRTYCDRLYKEQLSIYEKFGLSFNWFGRSSSVQNQLITQQFAKELWNNGFLEERESSHVFSVVDDRFLPDRYIVGTCPHCDYDGARGDQCENCTRVLDPLDLVEPRSAISGSRELETRETKHIYLKQSRFATELRQWIESNSEKWPNLVTSIALKWLDEGLLDRCITRDLSWGISLNAENWGENPDGQLPDVDGLKGKVFYVWFDAPIEYIAATREWAEADSSPNESTLALESRWQRWWKGEAAADVKYVQFMGKDNVPFHTIGFPTTIMGLNTELPEESQWKLVDMLKGFNWLNYYGEKFSTSQGRGIFMDEALQLLPTDCWRWYLIANSPERSDTSFSWEHFAATINKDLADVLGNFINRVLKFAASRFHSKTPCGGEWGDVERNLETRLSQSVTDYTNYLDSLQFRKAAQELRSIWVLGNEYITQTAPWREFKTNPESAAVSIRVGVNLIRLFAILARPIIPQTTERIRNALNLDDSFDWPTGDIKKELNFVQPGHELEEIGVLFQKIDDVQLTTWIEKYKGTD